MTAYRTEIDSMGEVKVPINALYGAQTQRAVDNFPISNLRFSRSFIRALGKVKAIAAELHGEAGRLPKAVAERIAAAARAVEQGEHDREFVIDIFQTGSGTSTNMNANEVIARLAGDQTPEDDTGERVHPNDHVNLGQSSNDVIPTAIRIAAALEVHERLLPALTTLHEAFQARVPNLKDKVKTGRTHLMDAMPVTFAQVFSGYARQVATAKGSIEQAMHWLYELPQGGTAVGTGINAPQGFAAAFAAKMATETGLPFREAEDHFEAQSTVNAPAQLSAALKTFACGLMKIANDLRWMNSGPNAGLGEIRLPSLQPGSSIMPGKVNPVVEESVAMVCAQVIGNDAAITVAAQSGNFELNVMLPVVAHNLLESITILANAATNLAKRSIRELEVCDSHNRQALAKNPILVTALNPVIGYEKGAMIAKTAYKEGRSLLETALEHTDLSMKELEEKLDPIHLAYPMGDHET